MTSSDPRNHPDARPEPYHLKNDPWERADLANAAPKSVERLSVRLEEY